MLKQLWWKFAVPILLLLSISSYLLAPYIDRMLTDWFRVDVEMRSRLVFNSVEFGILNLSHDKNTLQLSQYLERVTKDDRLQGILVCDPDTGLVYRTSGTPPMVGCTKGAPVSRSETLEVDGKKWHIAQFVAAEGSAKPLAVTIVHDLSFIGRRQVRARDYLTAMAVSLGVVLLAMTVGVAWLVMKLWVRALLANIRRRTFLGDGAKATHQDELLTQVDQVLKELEKSQRLEIDYRENWTPEALKHLVEERLASPELIVVSNREPYMHNRSKSGELIVGYPASGMVTAIEPVIRACDGLWVAHGSGNADRETVDKRDQLRVPPEKPAYTLQRVWLDEQEEEGYYYGYSNEGLWSLCHLAHVRPMFRDADWQQYQAVNEKFADAIAKAARTQNPVILIQDFHLALLPQLLRQRLPAATIAIFWHIPWPSPENFGICPQRRVLLDAMISADIVGFHTRYHCQNFIATVDRYCETNIDHEQLRIRARGSSCQVAAYPISIEWPPVWLASSPSIPDCRARILERHAIAKSAFVGIGVERWDFTKGVLERFDAIEHLLEKTPELLGKLVFIQIVAPTRSKLPAYIELQDKTRLAVERINSRFARPAWRPIVLLDRHHEPNEVFEYFRAADFCLVNSLHDGMNLVAKEFVASREDERGTLILSTFAGASRELIEALIVNPYDIPATADAIRQAWKMGEAEQRERMRMMRRTVKENNVFRWAGHMLTDIARVRQRQRIAEMRLAAAPQYSSFMDYM